MPNETSQQILNENIAGTAGKEIQVDVVSGVPAAITNYAKETGGNLASLVTADTFSSQYQSVADIDATGAGTAVNCEAYPLKNFALQVVNQVGASTWSVNVEISLDGVTFTSVLTHDTTDTTGVVKFIADKPARFFRYNVTDLTGVGANITVNVLGMK